MNSETEKSFFGHFLPEGILEYFDVAEVKESEGRIEVHLREKNLQPVEYQKDKLTSKGFFEPVLIQDFPIRGKASYLKVKRRRWLNESTGLVVYRNWDLVANGTRLTKEFAAFLKAMVR